jgi:hypothetical protein
MGRLPCFRKEVTLTYRFCDVANSWRTKASCLIQRGALDNIAVSRCVLLLLDPVFVICDNLRYVSVALEVQEMAADATVCCLEPVVLVTIGFVWDVREMIGESQERK